MITVETLVKEIDVDDFNRDFEWYSGTQPKTPTSIVLDNVITNNKKNTNHIIRVIYGSINTTDETEIRNIKKGLDMWANYEIILDYDEAGYVNQITIEN